MSFGKAKKSARVSREISTKSIRDKLLSYAFWLLGRRDYSEKEMRRKLETKIKLQSQKASPPQEDERFYDLYEKAHNKVATTKGSVTSIQVDEILEVLKRYNYIDDEKFTRMYITNRTSANPRGKYMIWRELNLKGISRDTFDKIWDAMAVDERDVAMEFLSRKRKVLSRYEGRKRKEKAAALLAGRGFSSDIVWDLARACAHKCFTDGRDIF